MLMAPRAGLRAAPALRRVAASAAAVEVDQATINQMSDADRAALAEQLGFRTIGKELPDTVSLQDIIKSMDPSVFEFNMWKAWGAVFTAIASLAASLYLVSISPWYLLPFAWALAGTAATGVSF
jgi:omega-6 fatty acid desaturase (delta-12 desaturase)